MSFINLHGDNDYYLSLSVSQLDGTLTRKCNKQRLYVETLLDSHVLQLWSRCGCLGYIIFHVKKMECDFSIVLKWLVRCV